MTSQRVALLPGSIRRDSVHRRLALVIGEVLADRGLSPEVIDLADHPMPIYDGDTEVEQGPPPSAVELHRRLTLADGLILVTPEYNGGPSALMKNAIDWVTRVERAAFRSLLIGLAAASPGARGAVAGLASMRAICEHMRLDIAPGHISIANSSDAFGSDDDGRWTLARPEDGEQVAAYVAAYEHLLAGRGVERLAG